MHSTDNLKDKYLGSGSELRKSIKKYGRDCHLSEIIEFLDDRKKLKIRESEILTEEILHDPMCMNLAKGGSGSGSDYAIGLITVKDKDDNTFCVHKNDSRYLSGELVGNQKGFVNAIDNDGNIYYIDKNDSRYLSGELKYILKDIISVKNKNGETFGVNKNDPRYLSGELVGSQKGFVPVKDKNGNTFSIDINDPRYLSGELYHVSMGMKLTDEAKKKISKNSSLCQKGNNNSQYGTMWITNDINNQRIKKIDVIPIGWKKGRFISNEICRKLSDSNKGKCIGNENSQYGTIWITNGINNKKIKKDEEIPNGWRKGSTCVKIKI
jgi:hypothetical protein